LFIESKKLYHTRSPNSLVSAVEVLSASNRIIESVSNMTFCITYLMARLIASGKPKS